MYKGKINPSPGVIVSTDPKAILPLSDFNTLVMVEPNLQEWVFLEMGQSWLGKIAAIDDEVGWKIPRVSMDGSGQAADDYLNFGHFPIIVRIQNSPADLSYFEFSVCASIASLTLHYKYGSSELPDLLPACLRALNEAPHNLNVAVFGGMYGDEVLRVANAFEAAGIRTTVLVRYCFSDLGTLVR
jgi:hypothetical protein